MIGIAARLGRAAWPAVRNLLAWVGAGAVLEDATSSEGTMTPAAKARGTLGLAALGVLVVFVAVIGWRLLDRPQKS